MIAVYLVPHSLRGSELDYGKVEGGRSRGGRDHDGTLTAAVRGRGALPAYLIDWSFGRPSFS